ncbi:hypothetical protein CBR_g20292 [Chara braunii]|uniref:Uncharacterized protein n=1 Tax=Chara braunii TaxID=69332 RepID=A0A388L041_CHABU|nr:hypothetical protein CBR_g20292 [Chara braunii]|eukprot:GBG75665.1 hypothetical protein CBR_g20292 [Chara braunii]
MLKNNGPNLHSVALVVAGFFVLTTLSLSAFLIVEHLSAFKKPEEQTWIIGVIIMVPIYAVDSFISLWKPNLSMVCEILRNCYEAYAIYSFGCYLVACLGGESRVIEKLEAQAVDFFDDPSTPLLGEGDKELGYAATVHEDEQPLLSAARGCVTAFFAKHSTAASRQGEVRHPIGLAFCLDPWIVGDRFYRIVKVGIVQYDVALSAMRSGFRDFAREVVTHIGGEVKQLRDNVGKFCEGAIQGAKAAAAVEGEGRPRKDLVKLKFPDAYGGKKDENFDNWEASVNSYIYLQHILMEEQVLVAFQALKDEAASFARKDENFDNWEASVNSYIYLQHILIEEQVFVAFQALKDEAVSFARSLARTAGCENNLVAYSKVAPLSQFLKRLKERFADPTRGIRASDKLQTIHSRQWRSAKALKGTMDDLVAVPDHGVTEPQLVQLFYRAIPEALHGHFFDKSQQVGMTYDALSREVVLYESKSMPVTTFWHKDLEKRKKWKDRTISGQVKAKDHLILTLEEGGAEEVPYDQIEWGLGEEYSSVGQGRSYAAVAVGVRPQGRGGGQGQRGQAMGGRGPGVQGVGDQGNRQAGGRGQGPPSNRQGSFRSPQ